MDIQTYLSRYCLLRIIRLLFPFTSNMPYFSKALSSTPIFLVFHNFFIILLLLFLFLIMYTDEYIIILTFSILISGQPKRHLLTTGWSVFVSTKRLFAGDAVLFIRCEMKYMLNWMIIAADF